MNLNYAKLLVGGLRDNSISFPPLTNSALLVPVNPTGDSNNGGNYRILLIKKYTE